MKKLFYLILPILLIACKEKEDMKPESKTAPLLIEMNGVYVEPVYCKMFFTRIGTNSEYYTSDSGTSISYTLSKPDFKGDCQITFGSTTYKVSDDTKATGYGSGCAFTIKVTYNGQVLADTTFQKGSGISVNLDLPFIE